MRVSITVLLAVVWIGCGHASPPPVPSPVRSSTTGVLPVRVDPEVTENAAVESTCDPTTDACWMRVLELDASAQVRALEALHRAAAAYAPIAADLLIWDNSSRVECVDRVVPELVSACDAGLAFACLQLYGRGGCLRSTFEQWQGDATPDTWRAGTFAYVTRDIPLLSSGVSFGTVRRGTKVVVLGKHANQVVIHVLEARLWYPQGYDTRFMRTVDDDVLTTTPLVTEPHPVAGLRAEAYARLVEDTLEGARAKDVNDPLHRDHASWRASACTPIEIVEEVTEGERTFQRVRQELDGVALEGWIYQPILRTWGGQACSMRALDAKELARVGSVPVDGYETVDSAATTRAVKRWMRRTGTLTLIEFDETTGPHCVTGQWKRGELLGEWHDSPAIEGTERTRSRKVQSFGGEGRRLSVSFSLHHDNGTRTLFHCQDEWEVVRVSDVAIEAMPLRETLVAFHPDDVTRWWLTPQACEAALAARPSYPLHASPRAQTATLPALVLSALGC